MVNKITIYSDVKFDLKCEKCDCDMVQIPIDPHYESSIRFQCPKCKHTSFLTIYNSIG